jgi:hypothetical protein
MMAMMRVEVRGKVRVEVRGKVRVRENERYHIPDPTASSFTAFVLRFTALGTRRTRTLSWRRVKVRNRLSWSGRGYLCHGWVTTK